MSARMSGKRLIRSQLFIQNTKWLRQCAKNTNMKTTNRMQTIQMNIWAGHSLNEEKEKKKRKCHCWKTKNQTKRIHWSSYYEYSVFINEIIWFSVLYFFFPFRSSHHFKFSNVWCCSYCHSFVWYAMYDVWCRPHLFIYFKLATSILVGYWSSEPKIQIFRSFHTVSFICIKLYTYCHCSARFSPSIAAWRAFNKYMPLYYVYASLNVVTPAQLLKHLNVIICFTFHIGLMKWNDIYIFHFSLLCSHFSCCSQNICTSCQVPFFIWGSASLRFCSLFSV